jgi:hypothetical protein
MSRQNLILAALLTAGLVMTAIAHADSTVSWKKAPEGTFQLTEMVLARGVEDRKPQDSLEGDSPSVPADGKRLYAYLNCFNKGETQALKVVWKRGEKVHYQATVAVKRSASWRTWAFIDARPSLKGDWTVSVLDSEGKELASKMFTIE